MNRRNEPTRLKGLSVNGLQRFQGQFSTRMNDFCIPKSSGEASSSLVITWTTASSGFQFLASGFLAGLRQKQKTKPIRVCNSFRISPSVRNRTKESHFESRHSSLVLVPCRMLITDGRETRRKKKSRGECWSAVWTCQLSVRSRSLAPSPPTVGPVFLFSTPSPWVECILSIHLDLLSGRQSRG